MECINSLFEDNYSLFTTKHQIQTQNTNNDNFHVRTENIEKRKLKIISEKVWKQSTDL